MNTDNLIERIHASNAVRRESEHTSVKRRSKTGLVALPAAAAILLLLLLPHHRDAQPTPTNDGIYCNTQCSPDEVLALMDNNINHIKQMQNS